MIGTQEDPLGEKEWIETVRGALRDITNISFKPVSDTKPNMTAFRCLMLFAYYARSFFFLSGEMPCNEYLFYVNVLNDLAYKPNDDSCVFGS